MSSTASSRTPKSEDWEEDRVFLPELTVHDEPLEAPPMFVRFWRFKKRKKKKGKQS